MAREKKLSGVFKILLQTPHGKRLFAIYGEIPNLFKIWITNRAIPLIHVSQSSNFRLPDFYLSVFLFVRSFGRSVVSPCLVGRSFGMFLSLFVMFIHENL